MLDVPMHICQTELSALVAVGQLGVIDPSEVEDGRLHIMHMDLSLIHI